MNEGRRKRQRVHGPAALALCVLTALLLVTSGAPAAEESADEPAADSAARNASAMQLEMPSLEAPPHRPPELRVALGPLTSLRSMNFEGDRDRIQHDPRPYVGGSFMLTTRLLHLEALGAYLMFDAEVGYGVTRNRRLLPDDPPRPDAPTTELTYGGARLILHRQVARTLVLGLGLGLQATSYTVQPNDTYTGHRYAAADLSVRARWFLLQEVLSAGLDLAAYPVFAVDNSGGAHGPAKAFGMRLQTDLSWRPFSGAASPAARGLALIPRYRYQRYRTQFPVSPLGSRGGISVDNQHLFGLLVGYEL